MKKIQKQTLIQNINYVAESIRNQYVTNGMYPVYQEKIDEAIDYTADGYPDNVSVYPLIEVEAEIMGVKPSTIAKRIIKSKQNWIINMVKIEKIRLTGIKNINKLTTIKKIEHVYNATINQLQNLK